MFFIWYWNLAQSAPTTVAEDTVLAETLPPCRKGHVLYLVLELGSERTYHRGRGHGVGRDFATVATIWVGLAYDPRVADQTSDEEYAVGSCLVKHSGCKVVKRCCPSAFPHGEREVWPVFRMRVWRVGELHQSCTDFCSSALVIADVALCSAVATIWVGLAYDPLVIADVALCSAVATIWVGLAYDPSVTFHGF
eukprot:s1107_g16.t1